MPIFTDEPMNDHEREWMQEYEAVEAEILAKADRPLPGPLVVKMTIQRMGYRHPSHPPRGPRRPEV